MLPRFLQQRFIFPLRVKLPARVKLHRSVTTAATESPKSISLRARPFLFVGTFFVVHQIIATSSLIPAYYSFKSSMLDSGSFLAGPVAGYVLKIRLPIPGTDDWRVEDVVEIGLRMALVHGWTLFKSFRERRALKKEEKTRLQQNSQDLAEEAIEAMEGKQTGKKSIKERFQQYLKGKAANDSSSSDATSPSQSDNLSVWSRIGLTSEDVKLRAVMNASAAYLLVKSLFPLRLALSLFLTPRLARAFKR
ncbi:hypothetical protein DL96DRAFT_299526 [Flagelloscypha sp. PMI_526]|nr:hypothetical protein DL96DRAFT_299526 [Flagelloscypha sp. PMI_526]